MDRPIRHRQYSDMEFELYRPQVHRAPIQAISALSESILGRQLRHPKPLSSERRQLIQIAAEPVCVEGLVAQACGSGC